MTKCDHCDGRGSIPNGVVEKWNSTTRIGYVLDEMGRRWYIDDTVFPGAIYAPPVVNERVDVIVSDSGKLLAVVRP